jgi:hypothetical protein
MPLLLLAEKPEKGIFPALSRFSLFLPPQIFACTAPRDSNHKALPIFRAEWANTVVFFLVACYRSTVHFILPVTEACKISLTGGDFIYSSTASDQGAFIQSATP